MDFSILLDENKCRGCTNCMKKCPTQAIRIKNEKAVIDTIKCIYCGECIKACPYNAYTANNVRINKISKSKYSIVIPSTTIYGQFPIGTKFKDIKNAIKSLGFSYVYDESYAAELASKVIHEKVKNQKFVKPMISTSCPAIVRLIKIRYMSLLDNLVTVESPTEIAARLAKHKVHQELDIPLEDILVYYISPCPAKMLTITNPIGAKRSSIDHVIPLNSIYGDLLRGISSNDDNVVDEHSTGGVKWAISGGQCVIAKIDSFIAVHGIENIIAILEEIENGKLNDVDYVELSACTEGCVGGVFTVVNPFIAKRSINHILNESKNSTKPNLDIDKFEELFDRNFFDIEIINDSYNKDKLSLAEAIERMEGIEAISAILPGLDCGSCGSPTCRAYAEDVYNGHAELEGCVLLKTNRKV